MNNTYRTTKIRNKTKAENTTANTKTTITNQKQLKQATPKQHNKMKQKNNTET